MSFLQVPSWAGVKAEWAHAVAGLVRRRRARRRRARAAAPGAEGASASSPTCPRARTSTGPASAPAGRCRLARPDGRAPQGDGRLRGEDGPAPSSYAAGTPNTLKDAIAAGDATRLRDVEPDESWPQGIAVADRLQELGWSQKADTGAGFGDVQPRYVFQVPLAGRTEADLLSGFNQLWRRNIKKADKAGVEVVHGTCDDLPAFHEVYVETAERDRFTPRGLAYFQRMWRAMTQRGRRAPHALPRAARGPGARRDDDGHRRPARLVLLRRLVERGPRRTPVERDPVGDDPRRARRAAARSTTCAASATPSTRTTTSSGSSSSSSAPAATPRSTSASGTSRCAPCSPRPSTSTSRAADGARPARSRLVP